MPDYRGMSLTVSCIPNSVTMLRVAGALMLPVFETMSIPFLVCYLFCGITDTADGFLARRLHAESRFGAALDGCADAVFFLISLMIFLSYFSFPLWVWTVFGGILAVKISTLILRYKKSGVFGFSACRLNKTAGVLLFLFPFLALCAGAVFAAGICGGVAVLAAVHELYSVGVLE